MSKTVDAARIVIAGGGIAGLEAAMALADSAGRRADITMVAPETEFVLKPMVVRQPFGGDEAERHGLSAALEGIGARHVRDSLSAVHPERRAIALGSGEELAYDFLVVCVGGRPRPAYACATTFWSSSGRLNVDELIKSAAGSPSQTLAVAVPPLTTWPLPAYELALLLSRRIDELDLVVSVRLLTPEDQPLGLFGLAASATVAARLATSGVELETGTRLEEVDGSLVRVAGKELGAGVVIALPTIDGPSVPGLPADEQGFLRVDEHCRVIGVDSVYAAGDGTSFPVKQGGIAAQQADAAAAHIAAALGATIDPAPFQPVLRGELLTGDESIKMKHAIGGGDAGSVSPDYLWWPRTKVGARYLSAWLAGTTPRSDLEAREMPIEVEASWPHRWHAQPLTGP